MKKIDYITGEIKEVNIEEIGSASVGANAPKIVLVDGVKGYYKKSRNNRTFDSFEYLISVLGKMLNIKVADTYIFEDGSIFSKSVIEEDEELIMYMDLLKYVSVSEEEICEVKTFNNRLEKIKLNGSSDGYIINDFNDIDYAINIFIRMIKKLNLNNKEEIIKDYIRMCFLDCLTGNKDRTGGNFGLVKTPNDFEFASLFDNSTISYPNVPDNLISVNMYYFDRKQLMSYLIKNYSNYIEDILQLDFNNVINDMDVLSSHVLDKDAKNWFDNSITNNILKDLSEGSFSIEERKK